VVSNPAAKKSPIGFVLIIVVVALRVAYHPMGEVDPVLLPEVPDTWWASLFSTHDWLLHGFDEGEWLGLVHAYLGGPMSEVTRPPAYPILAAALTTVVGHPVFALHLVSHLASAAACIATYIFGKRLTNGIVGFWAAVLMAIAPRVIMVQDEIAAFPLLVLATLCLGIASLAVIERPRLTTGITLGLALTFSLTAHYTSAPFVVPIVALVVLSAGRSVLRPLAIAIGLAAVLTATISATLPAKPIHGGGSTLSDFYRHALNHPDGRFLDLMPDPSGANEKKAPIRRPGVFSSRGAVGRTILKGPAAAGRSMTSGMGPSVLAPLVMVVMLLGIGWPSNSQRSGRLKRWRPSLWLLCFLAPLLFAAAALEGAPNHRYLAFATPFSAVAFVRGLFCLWQWIGSRMAWRPRQAELVTSIVVLGVVGHTAWSVKDKHPPPRTVQVQRHAIAQQIRAHFGPGGFIIGATGQMGPISAYGALTRRTVCSLGSGGGTCLDSHSVRDSLAQCVQALLQSCHDGRDTPYVLDMLPIHRIRDPHTLALNDRIESQFERVTEIHFDHRKVSVYALDEPQLQAIVQEVR
jgi:4-amino-4-deoxy-L-arabinose transferase-like glycosyltransferase